MGPDSAKTTVAGLENYGPAKGRAEETALLRRTGFRGHDHWHGTAPVPLLEGGRPGAPAQSGVAKRVRQARRAAGGRRVAVDLV